MTRTWGLRAAGVIIGALGVVPAANYLAATSGLAWWRSAVLYWILWGGATTALALLLGVRFREHVEAAIVRGEAALLRPSPRIFSLAVAALMAALTVALSGWLYGWQGVTLDELSQQWQARLLTHGRLAAVAEPHGEFFSTLQTVETRGLFFSQFPIGSAVLKALGMLAHAPWLVNPLVLAAGVVAVYRFVAATAGEVQARLVALLMCAAPFVLFIGASQLDHPATLCFIWLAFAALPAWLAAGSDARAMRAAAVVGGAIGVAATIRPYDAAIAAVSIGAFQLVSVAQRPRLARSLVAQLAAGALPIALLLLVNHATTGHALTFAYDVANGADHRPGFHLSPLGFEHTPRHGLFVVSSYLLSLDVVLLGWPVPALLLVVLALLCQRAATRWDYLLLGFAGAAGVAYWYYWGEGTFQGPRFLYPLAPVLLLWVVRVPGALRDRVRDPGLRAGIALLAPVWLLTAWLVPTDRARPSGMWSLAARARERNEAHALLVRGVRDAGISHAVVFVSDGWHARLSARLRRLGARPFMAQRIVGNYDACALQQLLDRAERLPTLAEQSREVFAVLDAMPLARPVPGLTALQQLAFTPGQPLPPACDAELRTADANGVDFARVLPYESLDPDGRIGGDIVFARDYGGRNELLRSRFGDRSWWTARIEKAGNAPRLVLAPYGTPSTAPPSPAPR